jgi:P-type Cu2+ transporter
MAAAEPVGVQRTGSTFVRPELVCAHCGLPVPFDRSDSPEPERFCCDGCRSVYAVLQAAGLDDYYRHREASDQTRASPRLSHRKFQELDDSAFQAQHCRALEEGVSSVEFFLEGIHCSACVWLVERVSRVAPAVLEARFDLTRSVLQLTWRTAASSLSALARALDSLGYCPHPTSSTSLVEKQRKGDRALLLRLGIAGAAAGNVMLMALALYSGKFSGMTGEYLALFRWGSLLIATPTVFWTGNVFFRGGLGSASQLGDSCRLPR